MEIQEKVESKDETNENTGLASTYVTLVTIAMLESSNVTLVTGGESIMGANQTKS